MSIHSYEKIVYLVRHGQSEGNVGPVFQSNDTPLTEVGRTQASRIADRLNKLELEQLIASPWTRAKQTAEIVSQSTGLAIEFSDLFVERRRPTSSQGKPRSDVQAKRLEEQWRQSLYNPDIRAEDGENFADIISRADQALSYLASQDASHMAVVTHGYFLRTMVARVLLGESLSPAAFESVQNHIGHQNTGLTVLVYNLNDDPGWSLWIFNDHAHLAD